ncbi:hypothetical protein [Treponema sp. OMZ 857]|jgi:hypothetical protein|uniref:hypothetical protein n=1 Tax=Treponema sp. OMZ 857 TaxID=1643513 RepID=UPI0020A458D2|nr:hypothetical protein [Treponema sp. OMZ 857]UTC44743.1 hypothetical protein E4N66_12005 [Treponema sp. OMZ 857]
MEKKNKIVLSVIVFFITLLCIFYISNRKPKFDKNKWDKVSHRFEMSDDLIQILEKKRLNKEKVLELLGTAAVEMEYTKDNELSYFLKQGSIFTLGMPFTYLSIKFDDSGNYISSKIYSFEF